MTKYGMIDIRSADRQAIPEICCGFLLIPWSTGCPEIFVVSRDLIKLSKKYAIVQPSIK
jgi:hypothetical protein